MLLPKSLLGLVASKHALRRTADRVVRRTLEKFKRYLRETYPHLSEAERQKMLDELHEKLELDMVRAIALVRESIAKERLDRAVIVFAIVVVLTFAFLLATGGLGSLVSFIAPPVAAFTASFASIVTIKLSCDARIRGTAALTTEGYKHEIAKKMAQKAKSPASGTSPTQNSQPQQAAQIQTNQGQATLPAAQPNSQPTLPPSSVEQQGGLAKPHQLFHSSSSSAVPLSPTSSEEQPARQRPPRQKTHSSSSSDKEPSDDQPPPTEKPDRKRPSDQFQLPLSFVDQSHLAATASNNASQRTFSQRSQ